MDTSKVLMAGLTFTNKELELIYDSVANTLTSQARHNYAPSERETMRDILDVLHETMKVNDSVL